MTLLELCTARVVERRGRNPRRAFDVLRSVPEATRAAEAVLAWAVATVEGSERPVALTREYAAFWGKSQRQSDRDRALVRALFEPDEFDRLVQGLAGELRRRGVRTFRPGRLGANVSELQAVDVGLVGV